MFQKVHTCLLKINIILTFTLSISLKNKVILKNNFLKFNLMASFLTSNLFFKKCEKTL